MSQIKNWRSFSKIREHILGKDTTKKDAQPEKDYSKNNRRRYYLHSRLKLNGIYCNAHTRTIEMSAIVAEDMLFMKQKYDKVMFYAKELFSYFNYNTQIIIMKAQLTNADLPVMEEGEAIVVETLLKTEEIALRFTAFGGNIETYKKYASEIAINDVDTLLVAENTSSEILEISTSLEKVRKAFKQPYMDAGKLVDEYAKTISEHLDKARSTINAEITNYKTVQAAAARDEAARKTEELKKVEEAKLEEISRITRIEQQLNARIFGGYWMSKNDIRQTSAGCIDEAQCDLLLTLIAEKVPKADTYTYYGERHDEMIKAVKKRIAEHKIDIKNANADSKTIRSEAQEKISVNKVKAEVKTVESLERGTKQVDKETKKEEKAIIGTVQQARKGVRKTLKFIIIEPDKVSRDYWSVDENKIKEYMAANIEDIKKALVENKDLLPGVKFYIDENYASG